MEKCKPPLYPINWEEMADELKQEVGECENCRRNSSQANLHVHHVVPVSRGGSHAEENLKVLCSQCHRAAHGEDMAPVIEFFTGWEIPDEDFEVFRNYLRSTEMRPHGSDGYYIPLGDMKRRLSGEDERQGGKRDMSPMLDELGVSPVRTK